VQAFDAGKQARLSDLGLDDNPYQTEGEAMERRQWYDGWCVANLSLRLVHYPEMHASGTTASECPCANGCASHTDWH